MDSYVNLENVREEEQRKVMERIEDAGECPFCLDNLLKYHQQPIIRSEKYWTITPNQWSYENTKVHILFILRAHKDDIRELDKDEWLELLELLKWITSEFNVVGGGIGLRFGPPELCGATVKHLHVHLIEAKITDRDDPNYIPVRIRVG